MITEITDANRSDLVYRHAESILEGMSQEDISMHVFNDIVERLEGQSDEELWEEISSSNEGILCDDDDD